MPHPLLVFGHGHAHALRDTYMLLDACRELTPVPTLAHVTETHFHCLPLAFMVVVIMLVCINRTVGFKLKF